MVISMRRADNPLLPVTAATVQVIVTLSEEAKEFKKGNFSISDNATIADPVALDPVGEDPNRYRVLTERIGRSRAEDVPILRGLYDNVDRAGDAVAATTMIHAAIVAAAADDEDIDDGVSVTAHALDDARVAYNAARIAYNVVTTGGTSVAEIATLEAMLSPTTQHAVYTIGIHPPVLTFNVGGDDNDEVTYPTVLPGDTPMWHPIDDEETIEMQIEGVDNLPLMRYVEPIRPVAGDGPEALRLYAVLSAVYDLFVAEHELHSAYIRAINAAMQADDDDLDDYFAVELGELVPTATGRDNMLHPYVVTITPKYENKDDIVLKIGAWEDTNIPISNKYNPPLTDEGYTEGVDKITIKVGKEILTALESGSQLYLPHGEGAMIPASGFYLLTKNKDGSGIAYSHEKDDENKAHKQTPEQLKFNVRAAGIPNLESNLANGVTIDLVAYDGTAATAAYISEVMWGSDASQAPNASNSQWD